jgi:hypothetical protein
MSDVVSLAIRALVGGMFVTAFAVLGEVLVPKRFAGIMSAAPSVALANLAIIVATRGHHYALHETEGMIVGACAFVAAALAGRRLVARLGSFKGSLWLCVVWLAVALAGYAAVLR